MAEINWDDIPEESPSPSVAEVPSTPTAVAWDDIPEEKVPVIATAARVPQAEQSAPDAGVEPQPVAWNDIPEETPNLGAAAQPMSGDGELESSARPAGLGMADAAVRVGFDIGRGRNPFDQGGTLEVLGPYARSIQDAAGMAGQHWQQAGRDFDEAGRAFQRGDIGAAAGEAAAGTWQGFNAAAAVPGAAIAPATHALLKPFELLGPEGQRLNNTVNDLYQDGRRQSNAPSFSLPLIGDVLDPANPATTVGSPIAPFQRIGGAAGTLIGTGINQGPEAALQRAQQAYHNAEGKGVGDFLGAQDIPVEVPRDVPVVGGLKTNIPNRSLTNEIGNIAPYFLPVYGGIGAVGKATEGVKGLGTVGRGIQEVAGGAEKLLGLPGVIATKLGGGPKIGAVTTAGAFAIPMALALVPELKQIDEDGNEHILYSPSMAAGSDPSGFALPLMIAGATALLWRGGGGALIGSQALRGQITGGLGGRVLASAPTDKPMYVRESKITIDVGGNPTSIPVEVVGVRQRTDGTIVDTFNRPVPGVRLAEPREPIARYNTAGVETKFANAMKGMTDVDNILLDIKRVVGESPDVKADREAGVAMLAGIMENPKLVDMLGDAGSRPDVQGALNILQRSFEPNINAGPHSRGDLINALNARIALKDGDLGQVFAEVKATVGRQLVRELQIKNPDWQSSPIIRLDALTKQLQYDPWTRSMLADAIKAKGGNPNIILRGSDPLTALLGPAAGDAYATGLWRPGVEGKAGAVMKQIEAAWKTIDGKARPDGVMPRTPDALNPALRGYNVFWFKDGMQASKAFIAPYWLMAAGRYVVNNLFGNEVMLAAGTQGRALGIPTEKVQLGHLSNRGIEGVFDGDWVRGGGFKQMAAGTEQGFVPQTVKDAQSGTRGLTDMLPSQKGRFRAGLQDRVDRTIPLAGKTLDWVSLKRPMELIGEGFQKIPIFTERFARRQGVASESIDVMDKVLRDRVLAREISLGATEAEARVTANSVVGLVASKGHRAALDGLHPVPDFSSVPKDLREPIMEAWARSRGDKAKFADEVEQMVGDWFSHTESLLKNDPREHTRLLVDAVRGNGNMTGLPTGDPWGGSSPQVRSILRSDQSSLGAIGFEMGELRRQGEYTYYDFTNPRDPSQNFTMARRLEGDGDGYILRHGGTVADGIAENILGQIGIVERLREQAAAADSPQRRAFLENTVIDYLNEIKVLRDQYREMTGQDVPIERAPSTPKPDYRNPFGEEPLRRDDLAMPGWRDEQHTLTPQRDPLQTERVTLDDILKKMTEPITERLGTQDVFASTRKAFDETIAPDVPTTQRFDPVQARADIYRTEHFGEGGVRKLWVEVGGPLNRMQGIPPVSPNGVKVVQDKVLQHIREKLADQYGAIMIGSEPLPTGSQSLENAFVEAMRKGDTDQMQAIHNAAMAYDTLLRTHAVVPLPYPERASGTPILKAGRDFVVVPRKAIPELKGALKAGRMDGYEQVAQRNNVMREPDVQAPRQSIDIGSGEPNVIAERTIKDKDGYTHTIGFAKQELLDAFDAAKTLKEKRDLVGLSQTLHGSGRYNVELDQFGHVSPRENLPYGEGVPMLFGGPKARSLSDLEPIAGMNVRKPWAEGVIPIKVNEASRMMSEQTPAFAAAPIASLLGSVLDPDEERRKTWIALGAGGAGLALLARQVGRNGRSGQRRTGETAAASARAGSAEWRPRNEARYNENYKEGATEFRDDFFGGATPRASTNGNGATPPPPPTNGATPASAPTPEPIRPLSDPRPLLDAVTARVYGPHTEMSNAFEDVARAVTRLPDELRGDSSLPAQVKRAMSDPTNAPPEVLAIADALKALDAKEAAYRQAVTQAMTEAGLPATSRMNDQIVRTILQDIPDPINPGWQLPNGMEYVGPASLKDGRWVTPNGEKLTFQRGMEWAIDPVPDVLQRVGDVMHATAVSARAAADGVVPGMIRPRSSSAELRRDILTAQQIATREGPLRAKALLWDYDQRSSGQSILDGWSPFSFWTVNHVIETSRWLSKNPQAFAAMAMVIRDWADKNKDRGAYDKFKAHVATLPNGDDMMLNPFQFFPYATQNVLSMLSPTDESVMKTALDYFGLSPHFPINLAMQWLQTAMPNNAATTWYTTNKPGEKRVTALFPQAEILRLLSGGKIDIEGGRLWDVQFPSMRQGIYGAQNPASNATAAAIELAKRVYNGEITELDAKRAILSMKQGRPDLLAQSATERALADKGIGNLIRYIGAPVSFISAQQKRIDATFAELAQAKKTLTGDALKAAQREIFKRNPDASVISASGKNTTTTELARTIRIDEQPAYTGGTPEQQARWTEANKAYGDAYGAAINAGRTPAQANDAGRAALQAAGFDYYKDKLLGDYYENAERKKALAEVGGYEFKASRDRYKDAPTPETAVQRDQAIDAYFRLRDQGVAVATAEARVSQQFGAQVWAGAKANSLRTDGTLTFGGGSGTTTSRPAATGTGTGAPRASTTERTAVNALWDEYNALRETDRNAAEIFRATNFDKLYSLTAKDKIPAKPNVGQVQQRNDLFAERKAILDRLPADARGRALFYEANATKLNALNEALGIETRYRTTTSPTGSPLAPRPSGGGSSGGGGRPGPPAGGYPAKPVFNPGKEPYPPPKGKRWTWKLVSGKVVWSLIDEGAAA